MFCVEAIDVADKRGLHGIRMMLDISWVEAEALEALASNFNPTSLQKMQHGGFLSWGSLKMDGLQGEIWWLDDFR